MSVIVVGGALANKSFSGGEAWVRLSWLFGFRKLGFEVYLMEEIGREHCLDQTGRASGFERSANLAYFRQVSERFGLSGSAALIYEGGERIDGLTKSELFAIAEKADLLINISGHLRWRPLMQRLRRKAYIDIDPAFTQFWHAAGNTELGLEAYDFHYTIAENINDTACCIPSGDIRWRTTRQPVLLEHWPFCQEGTPGRFTTVGTWRGPYGPIQHDGKTFGLKVHEFRKFIELPRRIRQICELALNIHPDDGRDLKLLRQHGWRVVDPAVAAVDPDTFRRYVQSSWAEFSVAQGIYVETNSGWFSDRTVRYLASGKPALVQDTGFSRYYPVGEGLLTFHTLDEAVAGAENIARRYDHHCQAAREIAATIFDSDAVLGRLVREIGIAS